MVGSCYGRFELNRHLYCNAFSFPMGIFDLHKDSTFLLDNRLYSWTFYLFNLLQPSMDFYLLYFSVKRTITFAVWMDHVNIYISYIINSIVLYIEKRWFPVYYKDISLILSSLSLIWFTSVTRKYTLVTFNLIKSG